MSDHIIHWHCFQVPCDLPLIYYFTCEITKLLWKRSVCLSTKIGQGSSKWDEDERALKEALENLNTLETLSAQNFE